MNSTFKGGYRPSPPQVPHVAKAGTNHTARRAPLKLALSAEGGKSTSWSGVSKNQGGLNRSPHHHLGRVEVPVKFTMEQRQAIWEGWRDVQLQLDAWTAGGLPSSASLVMASRKAFLIQRRDQQNGVRSNHEPLQSGAGHQEAAKQPRPPAHTGQARRCSGGSRHPPGLWRF